MSDCVSLQKYTNYKIKSYNPHGPSFMSTLHPNSLFIKYSNEKILLEIIVYFGWKAKLVLTARIYD